MPRPNTESCRHPDDYKSNHEAMMIADHIKLVCVVLSIVLVFVGWRASRILVPLCIDWFSGRRPRILISGKNPKVFVRGKMKCPECGSAVTPTPPRVGELAFECKVCGCKATWPALHSAVVTTRNDSNPDPALIRQIRKNVIELLNLYASEAEQREYQKNVPWVPVPTELVCMWFDDTYHPEEDLTLVFSPLELEALTRFHAHFDRLVSGDEKLKFGPDLEELLRDERWRQLMDEATAVLKVVTSPDVPQRP